MSRPSKAKRDRAKARVAKQALFIADQSHLQNGPVKSSMAKFASRLVTAHGPRPAYEPYRPMTVKGLYLPAHGRSNLFPDKKGS